MMKRTGAILAALLLASTVNATTEIPQYADVQCKPDGTYQHCTVTTEDGKTSQYWWRYDKDTECTTFWWIIHPEKGNRQNTTYCPKKS